MMGTRQSGEGSTAFLFDGDSRLLEEVSAAVKTLRKTPSEDDTLQILNRYVASYFSETGHVVALN